MHVLSNDFLNLYKYYFSAQVHESQSKPPSKIPGKRQIPQPSNRKTSGLPMPATRSTAGSVSEKYIAQNILTLQFISCYFYIKV